MSRQYSPFAALSSREQQERWLEFQSARLPYVNGEVEPTPEEKAEQLAHAKNREGTRHVPAASKVAPASNPLSFQQAQHRQYDAVMKRMTEAAKHTGNFQSFPLSR